MIKRLYIILFLFTFTKVGISQNTGASLNVFSDQEPFLLYINNILYNEQPRTKVRVESLPNRIYELKIVPQSSKFSSVLSQEKVYNVLNQALDITFSLIKNRRGNYDLMLFSMFPIHDQGLGIQQFATYSFGKPIYPLFDQNDVFASHQMTTSEFQDFLSSLKSEGFDKEKINIAKLATIDYAFSVDQIAQGMKLFSWDDGKFEFAELMFNKCLDKNNYLQLVDMFTFSSAKDKFKSFVKSKPLDNGYINQMNANEFNDFLKLLKKESFDDEKTKLISIISSGTSFDVAQVRAILKTFSFDDGKLNTAKILFANCTDKSKYYTLTSEFSFSSNKKELQDFIKGK